MTLTAMESVTTEDRCLNGAAILEAKDITLRFGGVTAIQNISFDVKECSTAFKLD